MRRQSESWSRAIYLNRIIYYYFKDIIEIEEFDFGNILLDEKSYENVLVYDISHKTLIGAKTLGIRFDKKNEFIRVYDGTR